MMARTGSARQRRRKRLGRRLLLTLSTLFVVSGVLRMGGGTGAALAREVTGLIGEGSEAGRRDRPMPDQCAPQPEIAALLAALQQREASVTSRETALSDEMLALGRARAEIAREMAALREAESQLEETLALADGAAEGDLARLTRMYEVMKPKEAAPLFQEMDPVFAAGFLGRMQPESAAAILSGMEPKSAYRLSIILAGRNGSVPTE